MKRLIPYPTLAGDIRLEVREAQLDGVPLNFSMISRSQRTVALHEIERAQWDEARLTVRLTVPRQEMKMGTWSGIGCIAVLSERRTNTRSVTPLAQDDEDAWRAVVTLHRDRHLGQVELVGQVVATVVEVPGRLIATSDPWTIDLEARHPTEHSSLPHIMTIDFGDDAHRHLNPYKGDPWMIEAAGDQPVVYLNSSFEGLLDLLDRGDRPARQALSSQIAAEAWTAMFHAAAYVADIDEDQPLWPADWRGAVLRRLLPDMFPDRSPDDALIEIATRRLLGEGGGDLQSRLMHAVGKQVRRPRRLGDLIRTSVQGEPS
jgi:hypothetical protein